MDHPETTLLSVHDLEVAYGTVQVLWGISLTVKRGQIVTIIGANGAGKSTTLNTISGVLRARRGRIVLNGEELAARPPHQRASRRMALVPEGRQLWPKMSVEENLLMGGFPPNVRHRAQQNLEQVYEMFPRLKERRSQLAGTLSGGEQQMCAIGRGLMAEPELLMLDEPSLGLAPKIVDEIFTFIRNIGEHGVTILLVAQNVDYALRIADQAYLLETGKITREGSGPELLANDYVRQAYLGSS